MANLSIKELAKRNNFNVFVRRIRTGQGFYIAGQDDLILLDPLLLDKINDINDKVLDENVINKVSNYVTEASADPFLLKSIFSIFEIFLS